jgi:hypothetical protein
LLAILGKNLRALNKAKKANNKKETSIKIEDVVI